MIAIPLPALANFGGRALALTASGAGVVAGCTATYLVGRFTARVISATAVKAGEAINEWDRNNEMARFESRRAKIARHQAVLKEAVELEIARKIQAGELFPHPTVANAA